ncbi:MAG: YgiQ family radical SAM protein [Desulfuromonadaceae bacterium]|nr:YgiQ family radical SAM protein [Desulfuromonadaceae bacterium]
MTPAKTPTEKFIPVCREDMQRRGWDELDVLFVSGDAYVDHPAFGTPLLARLLEAEGFRVGILAQPDWRDPAALQVMGRPRLYAAISAGAMDSLVNHYTAAKKIRRDDAYTPGGQAGARPNRAVIAYTAAVKGAFKGLPTVIGGIEASLRRLAHYDYWSNAVRRSILIDAKADLLLFGMAETALVALTQRLHAGEPITAIRDLPGTAGVVTEVPPAALQLPAYEDVATHPAAYNKAFTLTAAEANPFSGRPLVQAHDKRSVLINRPALPLGEAQLDRIYALPFQRLPHPSYTAAIPAYEQIKFSITSHRGCFGGCAFCAITHHQGKFVQSRSHDSIRREVERLSEHPDFRGTLTDVGGPTANMYGLGCADPAAGAICRRESCLFPAPCQHLRTSDRRAVKLLADLSALPQVKHLFVASGIRFDLLEKQPRYFDALLQRHVGGLLKVAPEAAVATVTKIMRKPGPEHFSRFLERYRTRVQELGQRYGIVPYLISAHPGCTLNDMIDTALFLKRHQLRVEQVQEFTPTPGSLATCIYHTGRDPYSDAPVHVPREARERRLQKALLLWHLPEQRQDVMEALRECGREDVADELFSSRRAFAGARQSTAAPPTSKGLKSGSKKRRTLHKQRKP